MNKRRTLGIGAALIALGLLGTGAWAVSHDTDPEGGRPDFDSSGTAWDGSAELDPTGVPVDPSPSDTSVAVPETPEPTETSATAGEPTPSESVQAPDPRPRVNVMVGFAEWTNSDSRWDVGAFVPSLIEDGGTCSLVATQGETVVRAEAAGLADASSTICDGLHLLRSDLRSGTWTVTVTYESETSVGSSDPITLEVK